MTFMEIKILILEIEVIQWVVQMMRIINPIEASFSEVD